MIPVAPPVTVLQYHNIIAAGSPPHPDPGCIPVDTFGEHLNSLFASGSVNRGAWSGPKARHALNRISVPAYLSGRELVSIMCHAPNQRWAEIERRAPWRKASIGDPTPCPP
jgi:hypothetical protein